MAWASTEMAMTKKVRLRGGMPPGRLGMSRLVPSGDAAEKSSLPRPGTHCKQSSPPGAQPPAGQSGGRASPDRPHANFSPIEFTSNGMNTEIAAW